jgi:hypothetical protein
MTIVSGLLGVRPKRAPPGMHRSIGRFGSYDGIEPLRVSQVPRNGILGNWPFRARPDAEYGTFRALDRDTA